MYVNQKGVKSNTGTYTDTGYSTGYYASDGNQHVTITFLNQSPLKNNMTPAKFAQKMNNVATYYW